MGTPYNSGNAPLPGQLVFDPDIFGPGYAREWYWPWHPRSAPYADLAQATEVTVAQLRDAIRTQHWFEPRRFEWTEWYTEPKKKPAVLPRRGVRR